jgi:hypothetical protein
MGFASTGKLAQPLDGSDLCGKRAGVVGNTVGQKLRARSDVVQTLA